MSISPDLSIWIIEDDYKDTIKYYLDPLEEIAREMSKAQMGLAFPNINVVLLGLDPNQERDYQNLKVEIRDQKAYTVTRPYLHSNPNYERNVDEFFDFLRSQLRDQDVVLLDPSAHGSQWWPNSGGASLDKALYFIYQNIHGWRDKRERGRILLVSHHSKLSDGAMAMWDETADARIPKLRRDPVGYRDSLRNKLDKFLSPAADWVEYLNPDGVKVLVPFVERLRGTAEGRQAFVNIGLCAANAILQILTPKKNCAKDLVEATGINSYCFDPLVPPDSARKFIRPLNLYDSECYRVLIRRRALYGLRRIWKELAVPKKKRDDEDAYKLWLEVVAGGYRWHFDESSAIEGIYALMRNGRLTLGPNNTIDLKEHDLSFAAKNSEVVSARLVGSPDNLRYQAGVGRFLRFFQGNITFIVRGERFKASGQQDRAKSYFEVRYSGDASSVPDDKSTSPVWDTFWRRTDFLRDFDQIRHGHVEKMQKQLIHRCYFKDVDAMVLFESPMPEEAEWWRLNRAVFEGKLQALAKDCNGFLCFNPGHQSDKDWLS